MQKGWIKLHRSLLDSDIWKMENQPFDMRSAWIDLLMLANHEDKEIIIDYKLVTVKRGQFITSVRKLGERWKWGKDRVLKYLRILEQTGMVTRVSDTHKTLLTIVNYAKFQDCQDTDEDTGKDTVEDTNETQRRHGSATNKNIKNDKEINNNRTFSKPTVDEVKAYCLERGNGIDANKFVNFYESKGWMIGKNKMKDWKAAVRTWEQKRENQPEDKKKAKFGDYSQRTLNFDELEKIAYGG